MLYVDYLAVYSDYSTDPRQPGAVPDTVIDGSSREGDFAVQIPGLHAENFDEFTLGYERLLGPETKLTVRGLRRDLRSSFGWGMDLTRNPIWVVGTPGKRDFSFVPPPKRQYTALEVGVEETRDRWKYRVPSTRSRALKTPGRSICSRPTRRRTAPASCATTTRMSSS